MWSRAQSSNPNPAVTGATNRRGQGSGARRTLPGSSRLQGFTLIELLVVVLIIGISLSFVTLAINTNSAAERLDREAQRLAALAKTAATDAILYGIEIGLDITPKGYRFVRLTPEGWQLLTGDNPLRPRELGSDLALVRLTVEDGERPKLFGRKDDGQSKNKDVRRQPEALFLSSGEILPFVLELHARDVSQHYRLIGHTDGSIELKQVNERS